MPPVIAVITGDLVASSKADSTVVDDAMRALSKAADSLSQLSEADTRFTRFRGDGWQISLDFPGLALRACLLMIAALRASGTGLDTRLSIGIGPFDSLGSRTLADASGEVFVLSGHALDQMPRSRRIGYGGGPRAHDPWLYGLLSLIDWHAARWSREQAEAIVATLSHADMTQTELAAGLNISRQALKARLNSSGLTAMKDALYAFESKNWDTDPDD